MRTLTLFAAVVAVVVVAASCARTVNVEEEKAALLALDAEWAKTAKDIDKYMTNWAPDATLGFANMPALKGETAIRDFVSVMANTPGMDISWTPTRADVGASGDVGYTAGSYRVTATNAAGVPATDTGKYLTTWRKIGGAWKATEDIGNSDLPPQISSASVVVAASAVKWIDPPPSVPPGAKMAAISGDPTKAEPFTVRLQLPAGYTLAPHRHQTDEHLTVLSGTFATGRGSTFDEKALTDLPAGSYAVLSATLPHFALAKTAVTLQVHGMGPFVVDYVNPADGPARK